MQLTKLMCVRVLLVLKAWAMRSAVMSVKPFMTYENLVMALCSSAKDESYKRNFPHTRKVAIYQRFQHLLDIIIDEVHGIIFPNNSLAVELDELASDPHTAGHLKIQRCIKG